MSADCLYAGVDVSKAKLALAVRINKEVTYQQSFPNTKAGIRKLIKVITKEGLPSRVVLEPTSRFHVALLLALAALPACQVMAVNPNRARKYQEAQGKRAKTDPIDARSLAKMGEQLEEDFIAYTPPSAEARTLQLLGRRLSCLVGQRAKAKCRLSSYPAGDQVYQAITKSLGKEVKFYQREIKGIIIKMRNIVEADPGLKSIFELLVGIRGIAEQSALQLMGELLVLPKGMGPRQWVACAGLDPRPQQSGQSNPPMRISRMGNRYLKQVLYMAAMTTTQFEPQVKAYYEQLHTRKQSKRLAQVVVMRRLLHGIWHMLDKQQPFDATKCFAIPNS